MLSKLKKSDNKGFTIIEIMIVLVIAGLILLIVFLAVPALQRNARNTQRKNDVGALGTSISNFISNNNGAFPTTVVIGADGQLTVSSTVAGTTSSQEGKFGYFKTGSVTISAWSGTSPGYAQAAPGGGLASILFAKASAVAPPATAKTTPDTINVVTGATCTGNDASVGTSRSYAIMYELEQSGATATTGGVAQCQST